MALNPNWPLVIDEIAWNQGYSGGQLIGAQWSSLEGRSRGQHAITRGKQYELDQCRAGTCNMSFENKDGSLDPSNLASIYAPHVVPYRPYRKRLQYPATVNRLLADQATAGDASGYAAQVLTGSSINSTLFQLDWTGPSVSNNVSIAKPSDGGQAGANAYQNTMASTAVSFASVFRMITSIVPGHTYSLSMYTRCTTTGQSPTVLAGISWRDTNGNQVSATLGASSVLTGGATPPWTRITASGTAPAGAVSCYLVEFLGANLAAVTIFQMDSVQFEEAASPSAFVQPGQSNMIFTGYVERYPQDWTQHGTYGYVRPVAVDAFAIFSQTVLPDPLTLVLDSPLGGAGPTFLYKFNDPSGATTFVDATGGRANAQAIPSSLGAGTVTAGTAVTAAGTAGLFQGSPGPVVNLASPGPFTGPPPMSAIVLSPDSTGSLGPGQGSGLGFTRMIAFRCTNLTTSPTLSVSVGTKVTGNANQFQLYLDNSAVLTYLVGDKNGFVFRTVGTADAGNWHLAFWSINSLGNQLMYGLDGSYALSSITTLSYSPDLFSGVDMIGGTPANGSVPGNMTAPFLGDLAFLCEWPYVLSSAQVSAVYTAWKTAYAGESSGSRYGRILGWAGYAGPTALDVGSTANMGPASNVFGVDALSALQAVTDTENGTHFVAADGTVTFKSRGSRYNAPAPTYAYGDTVADSLAYEDIAFDFDTSRLANLATATQVGTGQKYNASDATSQAAYGTFTLTRDVNSNTAAEVQDAATYLVQRFKDPHLRLQKLGFRPSANPSLWSTFMATDLNTSTQTKRQPPGASPQVVFNGWVEKVSASLDDQANGTWGYEISPADVNRYGQFTSVHSTLHTAASTGNTTISINALSDAATNVLRANLAGGQQLVLDIGLPAQETVTIAAGGVPSTGTGYTSATVTLTAGLANNHLIGAVVSEPMPSGVTNPAVYDNSAIFDNANARFTY